MFKVSVLDIEKAQLIFNREMVSRTVLPAEEGELTILDFHQPIVSCLQKGVIQIDQARPISIKEGIAKMQGNELTIMVVR